MTAAAHWTRCRPVRGPDRAELALGAVLVRQDPGRQRLSALQNARQVLPDWVSRVRRSAADCLVMPRIIPTTVHVAPAVRAASISRASRASTSARTWAARPSAASASYLPIPVASGLGKRGGQRASAPIPCSHARRSAPATCRAVSAEPSQTDTQH